MNTKAQIGVGVLISVFIAIVVGAIMLNPIASNVEQGTRANTGVMAVNNQTITGVLNTNLELTGQELVAVSYVTNHTTGAIIPAANYTVKECVRTSDGMKGICYKPTSAADAEGTGCGKVNISYTYYPNGYMDDAASRTIFPLVILFVCLALALFVLVPIINKIREF